MNSRVWAIIISTPALHLVFPWRVWLTPQTTKAPDHLFGFYFHCMCISALRDSNPCYFLLHLCSYWLLFWISPVACPGNVASCSLFPPKAQVRRRACADPVFGVLTAVRSIWRRLTRGSSPSCARFENTYIYVDSRTDICFCLLATREGQT